MKIYVASSWRNQYQPHVVKAIREAGHEVYDFKHPDEDDNGFHWSEIDPEWKHWTNGEFIHSLTHPIAESGFSKDMNALRWCDACVLVMPCGRSAHLELGWAIGADRKTAILLETGEPELMYSMVDLLVTDIDDILQWLAKE